MGTLKAPPLLLGCALLVWGWQLDLWMVALPLAVLLEAAVLLKWRWHLSDPELNRIVDGCSIVLVLVVLYALIANPAASAVFTVITWLPAILFPLIAVQRYSDREALPLTALSLQQRRRKNSQRTRTLDVSYPYFLVCLLAASIGQREPAGFYLAVMGLVAWGLWRQRNERFYFGYWLSLMVLAGAGGYFTHLGFVQLQLYLEERIPDWLLQRWESEHDPYRRSTALGYIGRLKLSNRIVLRVAPLGEQPVPTLLRIASYNILVGDTWMARTGPFQLLARESAMNWRIDELIKPAQRIRIFQDLKKGQGMLPLPLGTYEVTNIPAERVERNPMGAVKVLEGPDFIHYEAGYAPSGERSPPMADDRQIPGVYRGVLADIAAALELEHHPADKVPGILKHFFDEHFAYSLDLEAVDETAPPLVDFLRNTRFGHCEYFAAATVLLLRQAGIPARYVSGYSVQEYSPLEERFIVRRRHAHAWAIAYIDGYWRNVDTTPAVWVMAEANRASSPLTGIYDVLSWLWRQLAEWRMQEDETDVRTILGWLVPPLVLLLIWRLRRQKRISRRRQGSQIPQRSVEQGADSEFYRILDWYSGQGLERTSGETLKDWFARVLRHRDIAHDELLKEIMQLHYRYRFDPLGLSETELDRLRQRVRAWFESVV